MTETTPPAGPDAPKPGPAPAVDPLRPDLVPADARKPDPIKPEAAGPEIVPQTPPKAPMARPETVPPATARAEPVKPPPASSIMPPKPAAPSASSRPAPPQPAPPQPAPSQPAPSQPVSAQTHAPAERSRTALAVFSAIGFLLLLGGGFYLWQQIQALQHDDPAAQLAQLDSQIRSLREQVAQLAQRPQPTPPPPVDLKPVDQQIANVAQQLASLTQQAAQQGQQITAQAQQNTAVGQRLTALEQRPVVQPPPDLTALTAQIAALQTRVGQAESRATQVGDSAARAARLQAAGVALSFGQPVGSLPGAPPALARFATTPPPTDQSLRAGFDTAARSAEAASRPPAPTGNFADRMWARISAVVTVRHGDDVVVGAPAAKILGAARGRLEAGDLAGAVASLDGLDPAAAAAMADWRSQAQSLLEARAALASLAHP